MRRLHVKIDSNFKNVELIGVSIKSICRHVGFSETESTQIELCVVEAVNNSIEHGYEGREGLEVEMTCSVTTENLEIVVSDFGKPLDAAILETGHMNFNAEGKETLPIRGMGLFIMNEVMDSFTYSRIGDKNVFSLSKQLKKTPEDAAC